MIITCDRCKSTFKLDEGLLRDEGSRVRCSICKDIFTAYPSGLGPSEKGHNQVLDEELEETIALESPPVFDEEMAHRDEEKVELDTDFDTVFEKEMNEEGFIAISPDQIPFEADEKAGFKKALKAVVAEEEVKKEEEVEEVGETPPPRRKKGGRPLTVALGLLVIVLLAGASLYFFAPHLIPDSLSFLKPAQNQDISDPGMRRLAFKGVTGSFMPAEKLGQLFVIQGMVVNNYPKSRSFILIKASILDDKGKVVKIKLAYAGNVFTEKEIKELTTEKLNQAAKERTGKENANVNIKTQASVPFMLLFEDLPENLSEFSVEAVSSSQGE